MCSRKCRWHIINTMTSIPFLISELDHYDNLTKNSKWFNVQTTNKINSMNGFMYFVTGKSWKSGVGSYHYMNLWLLKCWSHASSSGCLQMAYHLLSALPIIRASAGAVLKAKNNCYLRNRAFVDCLRILYRYILFKKICKKYIPLSCRSFNS